MKRVVIFVGALVAMVALAQDIPVPCFPCEPDPPSTCSLCHTWGRQ